MWLFPFLAGLVSATFAALVLRSWAARRGPHLAAWGIALVMFAIASLAAASGMLFGWTSAMFRTYYLFGAIVNVPVLGLGTVYLLGARRVGHVAAIALTVVIVGAAIDVGEAPLHSGPLDTDGIPAGSQVLDEDVRTLSRIYSFTGFFVVAGGAAWSAIRLARRGGAHVRRLASANALIALGTTVAAIASGLARYEQGAYFGIGLFIGVSLMFLGFIRTRPRPTAP
jgi:hypothetical protein